ncbi:23S rRNA (guanine(748)-N(1))-methyltransferase [Acidipropionibacterium virtanenii]|uniref:23S rRNA (Guanine(748)-N(1))-methyltransferase n=2 Tax=Acidipropionibacterium virtanenii TaxID=2057246 RepID=A0A344UT29_9ACTN|nr:23S rRNA (guanine(748)-N(1))-methyltransferase [Acidipropionibacterium virtanenii]
MNTSGLSQTVSWLCCPTCLRRTGHRESLELVDSTLRCAAGHSLDVARQGHVTMIGARPGANADTTEMVAARTRVLESGLLGGVDEVLARRLARSRRILEAGAGTGHHLARILDAVPQATGLATDVSVAAIRRAARAHPRMAAVVADTWAGLPIRDGAVDAVLCVFAPRNRDEFSRVLAGSGHLVIASPLPDHLAELRAATGMIDIQADKHHEIVRAMSGAFSPISHDVVQEQHTLEPELAADAVLMGPSAHHIARPALAGPIDVTVAVEVTTFVRSS